MELSNRLTRKYYANERFKSFHSGKRVFPDFKGLWYKAQSIFQTTTYFKTGKHGIQLKRMPQKKSMEWLVKELRERMEEVEKLKKELRLKTFSDASPEEARALIEEIEVPALELIKDEPRKPKKQEEK
mgnify:CR=1 FL=1